MRKTARQVAIIQTLAFKIVGIIANEQNPRQIAGTSKKGGGGGVITR